MVPYIGVDWGLYKNMWDHIKSIECKVGCKTRLYIINPDHVKDIAGTTQDASRQRSHLMQLRSASVNEIQTAYTARPFSAVEYIRNYDSLSWINS